MPFHNSGFARLLLTLLALMPVVASAYSVSQGRIVDERNRTVQLRGVNWFGAETDTQAPHGLWLRNWKDSLEQMQGLGINALRIPLCPDTIHGAPVKPGSVDYTLNPDLKNLNSIELLDALIGEADRRGIYVVLDHHRPDCSGQSDLWYTEKYPESAWINDLTTLAERYRDTPHVLGIDLKNEPRGTATWGTGKKGTDWNLAAEHAAAAVLRIAPQWLIFVEGIEKNPTCSSEGPHFWGENLEPLACTPLDIPPDRLVLAPHTYGPDVHPQPYFNDPTFPANMPAIWERNFGQFLAQGYSVILGEFGGRYGQGGDPRDRAWQDQLVQYLVSKRVNSAFYWSWNPNSKDTGGLLQDDWKTIWPEKLELLKRLWTGGKAPVSSTASQGNSASESSAGNAAVTHKLAVLSDWGAGYCVDVKVTNPDAGAARWKLPLAVEGQITQSWNTQVSGSGIETIFRGVDWNAQIAARQSTHFGYCATRPAAPVAKIPSGTQTRDGIESKVVIDSDWKVGYCARVQVTNRGRAAQAWVVNLPLKGTIQNLWKARYTLQSEMLRAEGEDYNRMLKPGESAEFGFCVLR